MSDLCLPDGWEWVETDADAYKFRHIESGKEVAIAGIVVMVSGDHRNLQREIDYQIAKRTIEIDRDRLFEECGRDPLEFARRMAEGACL